MTNPTSKTKKSTIVRRTDENIDLVSKLYSSSLAGKLGQINISQTVTNWNIPAPSARGRMFSGYMSEGEILLTNERMENSIPYISLNSCKDTERLRSAGSWGTFRFRHLPRPWRCPPASCGSTRCNTDSCRCGQRCTSCGRSSASGRRMLALKHTNNHRMMQTDLCNALLRARC